MKYKKLEENDNAEMTDHGRIELAPLSSGTLAGGESSESLTPGPQAGGHANGVAGGGTLASAANDSGLGSYEESSERSANVEETSFSVVEPSLAVDEDRRGGEQWSKWDETNRQGGWGKSEDLMASLKLYDQQLNYQVMPLTALLASCLISCNHIGSFIPLRHSVQSLLFVVLGAGHQLPRLVNLVSVSVVFCLATLVCWVTVLQRKWRKVEVPKMKTLMACTRCLSLWTGATRTAWPTSLGVLRTCWNTVAAGIGEGEGRAVCQPSSGRTYLSAWPACEPAYSL